MLINLITGKCRQKRLDSEIGDGETRLDGALRTGIELGWAGGFADTGRP